MATVEWEQRLAALEAEVARLRQKLDHPEADSTPWWERISGTFANDPAYEKAMELGRNHRQKSLPSTAKPQSR